MEAAVATTLVCTLASICTYNRRARPQVGGTLALRSTDGEEFVVSNDRYLQMCALPPPPDEGETDRVVVPLSINSTQARLLLDSLADVNRGTLASRIVALYVADEMNDCPRVAAVAKSILDDLKIGHFSREALIRALFTSATPRSIQVHIAMKVFCAARIDIDLYRWIQATLRLRCRLPNPEGSRRITRSMGTTERRDAIPYLTQLLNCQMAYDWDPLLHPIIDDTNEFAGVPAFCDRDETTTPFDYLWMYNDGQYMAGFEWLARPALCVRGLTFSQMPTGLNFAPFTNIMSLEVTLFTEMQVQMSTIVPPPNLRNLNLTVGSHAPDIIGSNGEGVLADHIDMLPRFLPVRSSLKMLSFNSVIVLPHASLAELTSCVQSDTRFARLIGTLRQFEALTHFALDIEFVEPGGKSLSVTFRRPNLIELVDNKSGLLVVIMPIGETIPKDVYASLLTDLLAKCPRLVQVDLGDTNTTHDAASLFAQFPQFTRIGFCTKPDSDALH